MATARKRGELDISPVAAPRIHHGRGIRIRNDFILCGMVHEDRSSGGLGFDNTHGILLHDRLDSGVVDETLAHGLNVSGEEGLLREIDDVLNSALLPGIIEN